MKLEEIAIGSVYELRGNVFRVTEESLLVLPYIYLDFQPIEITADRLAKMGFAMDDYGKFYRNFPTRRRIYLAQTNQGSWSIYFDTDKRPVSYLFFVHQLWQLCFVMFEEHVYEPTTEPCHQVMPGLLSVRSYYLTEDGRLLVGTNPPAVWIIDSKGVRDLLSYWHELGDYPADRKCRARGKFSSL
ncbi:hypothetical protein MKQ68_18790 [Chitinophaga horti]|uniref:Uncharacterized protein n=1 Tax=Chitinophaga horti TaxID=2920382 RepID=A0ABY6IXM0_9BACT|nr:hypothetical protein [Chitinophaga horti]UYQ92138.1 hypothetical protein MKQ68_18790 [Chitinophaga horti]